MSRHSERSRPLGRHRAPIGALAALRAPFWHSGEPTVLFRAMAGGAALLIAAASLSALPQPVAGAAQPPAASQSSNALSTVSKSGTDTATNSTAISGGAAGTANPGDTIQWVTDYTNTTSSAAQVQWKDPITAGQSYVAGSLQLPPGMAPQSSTNGGASYTAGAPAAGATGVGATGTTDPAASKTSTTFSNSVASFNTPGGDGYSVEGFGGNIYTVYHHDPSTSTVFCSTLGNAICPGWTAHASYVSPAAGTPLGTGPILYTTGGVNGSFISNGSLYWPVEALAPTNGVYPVGLQCLNLTTLLSCGFTQLDTVSIAPVSAVYGQIAGDGIQAANGRYYYVDTNGNLLCFNPATSTSCGVTNGGIGAVSVPVAYFAEVGTYGNYLYFSYTTGNNDNYLFGYNVASATPTALTGAFVGPTQSGSPSEVLPVLSSTGAVLGACSVFHAATNTGCFSITNQQIANPYALSQYSFSPGTLGFGTGVMIGTKYYITYASSSTLCFDFALRVGTGQVPACTGFTGPADSQSYTVRPLANLPGCLADNGNGAQIVVFNGATGGPCVTATTSVSVQAPSWCDGQAHSLTWGVVKFNGLSGSEYSGGASVTVSGTAGPVAGFNGLTLAPNQTTLDISSIPATGSTASLTVSVNLSGVTNQAAVAASTISLTRTGDTYSQMCYSTTVNPVVCTTSSSISNVFTAITTAGASTDAPAGNSTAPTRFTVTPTAAQCTLTLTKTPSEQSGLPGDRVTYTIAVTNSGTLAYTAGSPATFSDSLANVLTDAVYGNDASASAGTVSYAAPTLSWSGPLAAGATATITYSATVNTPDTGPHSLANTVVSTQPSNCAAGSTDPRCTAIVPISDLTVVKSASPSDAGNFTVGQVVTYTFLITNTGGSTLTDVHPVEGAFSGSGTMSAPACPAEAASMAPGAQVACTATYTVTQADVDAGSITNAVTATGTPPSGPDPVSPPSTVTIPAPQTPAVTLVKSATPATITAAGQTVTYSFVVTNSGNLTLTNPTVAESAFTGSGTAPIPACPPATLVPGASVTCTATYVATQADVDAGSITNTATATGTPPSGLPVTSGPSTAIVTATPAPALKLDKSASPTTAGVVGDPIAYSFVLTNTGNTTLTSVTVDEGAFSGTGTLSAVTCPAGAASLAPNASVTCTASYTLTQADVDAGTVTNTATATGTPPTGQNVTTQPSTATVTIPPASSVSLVKSATPTTAGAVGDPIAYSFVVTNTGNTTLADVTVNEGAFSGTGTLSAVTCPAGAASLAPNASVTCTASYTLTQADVDAGKVTNTATATGTPPSGPPPVSPPSTMTVTIPAAPGITLTKSATPTTAGKVGDQIAYSFLVTNTGNTTLTKVTVDESSFTGTGALSPLSCPPAAASLAPGASVTCTASYTLTQADVDAGKVTNTATATATPPSGPPPVSPPSTVVVTIPPASALTLVKSASPSDQAHFTVGQLITYSFVVTNTGNTTLKDVTVTEGAFSGSGTLSPASCPAGAASLAPGAQVTCTATYTVTQADVDAGSITNDATATGTPPTGPTPVSPPSTVTIPAPQDPALTVVKSATPTTITAAGQTVTYSFVVTNTGNVTLTDAGVAETAFSGTGTTPVATCPAGAASLVPGAFVTCTATYTATQADVDAGSISNTAIASGTSPSGSTVQSPTSSATVTATPAPAITVVKSASPSDPDHYTVGQVITYSFLITNTGNTTLADVTATEGAFTGSGTMSAVSCPAGAASLAPAAQVTCTATYTLTQADVDAGSITNDATATGTPPTGRKPVSPPSEVTIPAPSTPSLALVKSATPSTIATAGQTVTYSFVLTNTGNVTLKDAIVTETAFTGTGTAPAPTCPSGAASLAPGASITCTATYIATQADVDAGTISNTATATGTPPSGPTVDSPPSTAVVTIPPTSAVTLVKSASPSDEAHYTVGQQITYSFLVTNTGNTTLADVNVEEESFTGSGPLSAVTCPAGAASLAPGDSVTCTATYTLTQTDVDAGSITNTATANGTPPTGAEAESTPSTVSIPEIPSPALTILKTADTQTASRAGQVITYTFLVTNTGNVTLTAVKPIEGTFTGSGALSAVSCPAAAGSLIPGANVTCTAEYTVTAADVAAGKKLSNTATATGVPPTGPAIVSDPSVVAITTPAVPPAPGLASTGQLISGWMVFGAPTLLLLGLGALLVARRRRRRA